MIFRLIENIQRYVLRLTQNPAIAEDVAQETYLRWITHKKDKKPIPEEMLRAWMYRTARNLTMDHFRREKTGKEKQADWWEYAVSGRLPEDPGTSAQRKEEMEQLLARLGELSPRHQEAVRLKFQEKLSYDEIAAVLGEPRTTVAWLLHEAICKLRERFNIDPVRVTHGSRGCQPPE